MSQDVVSDALNQIMNAKRAGKSEVVIRISSKFLLEILNIMKKIGYIDYEIKEKLLTIKIKDSLNTCRAIKPRYNVKSENIEKYVRRFLPSKNFGFIILSTSKGLMSHNEALEKKIGGSLIAYVY